MIANEDMVRTWTGRHRYVTSSMLAHAFIAVKRAGRVARGDLTPGLPQIPA